MGFQPKSLAMAHASFSFGLLALASSCSKEDDGNSNNNNNNNNDQCINVSGTVTSDGLTLRKPEEAARGCIAKDKNGEGTCDEATGDEPVCECEEKQPDFACLGAPANLGTPVEVTMRGCVEAFGLESTSYDLTVAIFDETNGGQATDPGYEVAGAAGAQAENTPAALLGKVLSARVDKAVCKDLGRFSLAGVPTETPLIVRVTDQNLDSDLRRAVDTYKYNVLIRNSAVKDAAGNPVADPVATCTSPDLCFVEENVNTIETATFLTIPRAAGVSHIEGGMDLYDGAGEGHIAGEVQDCTSQDTVQNAVVAIDAESRKLAYFNVGFPPDRDNLDDAKPEGTRQRTNGDGLYAVIGVSTAVGGAPVKVGAVITPDLCGDDGVCQCNEDKTKNPSWTAADANEGAAKFLGSRTVYVFPDSITILTFDKNLYLSR
ncbi:MAG: hypothetical protein HY791_09145 [Deltaproteobacteria bacterium]|nr:hypothetical protein [Deltaproteobacteria bacterium]